MLTEPAAMTTRPSDSTTARGRRTLKGAAAPTALVIIMIGLWEAGLRVAGVETYLFPKPSEVAASIAENQSTLRSHAETTAVEILLGFAIAVSLAVAISLALHLSSALRRAVFPLLVASQAIPLIVIAPVLVVIMGFGLGPKLAMVTMICFFPVVVTTVDGLQSTDPVMKQMMTTLYGNRWDILRRVEIPSALPNFFSGVRIGATYCAVGAIVGEWAGASKGLGFYIQQKAASLATADVFGAVVVICAISFALIAGVILAERMLVPWARR